MTAPNEELYDTLMRAVDELGARCVGDDRFIEDEIPAQDLQPTCNVCPVLALCEAYAAAAKPSGGVWAGRRWYTGSTRPRMQAGRRKTKHTDDDEPRVCWRCGVEFYIDRRDSIHTPCSDCRLEVPAPPGGWRKRGLEERRKRQAREENVGATA